MSRHACQVRLAGARVYNKIVQSNAHSIDRENLLLCYLKEALDCTAQERADASAQQQGCGCRAARVHGAR